uniref:protein-L-isoaspartate(D-aspartate) O-methyltransferase n=1 Tax=Cacopsylla melanoneura TaxID=428564 RepID=A0A8D8SKS6_9HEMI
MEYILQIAVFLLAKCISYSKQEFWDGNAYRGFAVIPPPEGLRDEVFNDDLYYEDTFFIRRSYAQFIEGLKERKQINHPKVEEVFYKVRRADFINVKPYHGFSNIPYAFDNQVTMETPSYISMCLEQLVDVIHNGSRVLDIGSGQGYMATCLAHLVGPHGKVYALEHDPLTVNNSLKNIKISSPELLQRGTLEVLVKDGRWGHDEGGPYDAIFFGGGTEEVSETIMNQLKPNGRIVAPVGNVWRQNLSVIDKRPDGTITSRVLKRVSADFLCTLNFQLHPEEFYQPFNCSNEKDYVPHYPPPPGVRFRAHTFNMDLEETTLPNQPTTKYEFLSESDDRYFLDQEALDLFHGPNKTKSKRKKKRPIFDIIQ